jgi:hypothetical protein
LHAVKDPSAAAQALQAAVAAALAERQASARG